MNAATIVVDEKQIKTVDRRREHKVLCFNQITNDRRRHICALLNFGRESR